MLSVTYIEGVTPDLSRAKDRGMSPVAGSDTECIRTCSVKHARDVRRREGLVDGAPERN